MEGNQSERGRVGGIINLADLYYKGKLPEGMPPPDICIELFLWEHFRWGPNITDKLSTDRLQLIFAVLEQRRVSIDAKSRPPSEDRMQSLLDSENTEKSSRLTEAATQAKKQCSVKSDEKCSLPPLVDAHNIERRIDPDLMSKVTYVDEQGKPIKQ